MCDFLDYFRRLPLGDQGEASLTSGVPPPGEEPRRTAKGRPLGSGSVSEQVRDSRRRLLAEEQREILKLLQEREERERRRKERLREKDQKRREREERHQQLECIGLLGFDGFCDLLQGYVDFLEGEKKVLWEECERGLEELFEAIIQFESGLDIGGDSSGIEDCGWVNGRGTNHGDLLQKLAGLL